MRKLNLQSCSFKIIDQFKGFHFESLSERDTFNGRPVGTVDKFYHVVFNCASYSYDCDLWIVFACDVLYKIRKNSHTLKNCSTVSSKL